MLEPGKCGGKRVGEWVSGFWKCCVRACDPACAYLVVGGFGCVCLLRGRGGGDVSVCVPVGCMCIA